MRLLSQIYYYLCLFLQENMGLIITTHIKEDGSEFRNLIQWTAKELAVVFSE